MVLVISYLSALKAQVKELIVISCSKERSAMSPSSSYDCNYVFILLYLALGSYLWYCSSFLVYASCINQD